MSATGDAPTRVEAGREGSQAGTTLIEALVVVAITALVALIGFPSLRRGLPVLAQRQTVAVVAARLRQARAAALRQDAPVAFTVAPDGRAYGASDGAMTRVPYGITVTTSGGGAITFQGDGSASGGAVRVRAARRVLAVTVASPGGAVAIGPG